MTGLKRGTDRHYPSEVFDGREPLGFLDDIVRGTILKMTTARKLRVLNISATVLLVTVVTLQSTQVISMFWGMALLVLIGVPTTVVWVILERRQGAEKMVDGA